MDASCCPAGPLATQLPVTGLGKAVQDGLSVWVPESTRETQMKLLTADFTGLSSGQQENEPALYIITVSYKEIF